MGGVAMGSVAISAAFPCFSEKEKKQYFNDADPLERDYFTGKSNLYFFDTMQKF